MYSIQFADVFAYPQRDASGNKQGASQKRHPLGRAFSHKVVCVGAIHASQLLREMPVLSQWKGSTEYQGAVETTIIKDHRPNQ